MKGDTVFRVYGMHAGREEDMFFGAFGSKAAAQEHIEALQASEMHGANWAAQYHDQGFEIREVEVQTDFEIPSRPKPRDAFWVKTQVLSAPDTWTRMEVHVHRRGRGESPVASYERDHAFFSTFEPFRQRGRTFALISRNYTSTAVLDLDSGEVIAEERAEPNGFCPVGFYVPDWWDVHDGSIIPGSKYWGDDHEWPTGDFGFVWGCHWGDDSSWKVQHLDLSEIGDGIIRRDSRYGYVALATSDWNAPWRSAKTTGEASLPPPFIRVSRYEGRSQVTFAVETVFDITTGALTDDDT